MTKYDEGGTRRSVWMPENLDIIIEQTRKKLGMNRSAFYKYAVTKLLQDLGALSSLIDGKTANDGGD